MEPFEFTFLQKATIAAHSWSRGWRSSKITDKFV